MRLRTKLFLSIGSLFVFVLVLSYFLENYMTKKSFDESSKKFKKKIEKANEKKRLNIEKFLLGELSEQEAKINSLLLQINTFNPMKEGFELEKNQYYKNIWLQSATLLSANKWVDLVQTSYNEQLSSLITVDPNLLDKVKLQRLDNGVTVAVPPSSDKKYSSYIAIPLTLSDFLANVPPLENPKEEFSKFYVLFSKESLMQIDVSSIQFQPLNLSINPLEPYIHWVESNFPKTDIVALKQDLLKAQKALKNNPNLLQDLDVKRWDRSEDYFEFQQDRKLDRLISRFDQIGMIWGLTTIISSGPFQYHPFSQTAPIGFVREDANQDFAYVLYKDQVFSEKPYKRLHERRPQENFNNTLSVILPKSKLGLFFANTLYIPSHNSMVELTIGINGDGILKNLALSTQRKTAFISHGILTSAYDSQGGKVDPQIFSKQDIDQMLSKDNGVIRLQNESYYFIHMQPFQGLDFHFYLLTPSNEEFGLIRALNESAANLISKISWQMRTCALIALALVLIVLSQIAKRVTKPISVLAKATHFVKEGKLDDIDIPHLKRVSQKNEVDVLYQSFADMVQGLKEKEKVRGVLNKVVSQEIADEILKEDPHLGGEEKEVTVFFADIRSFTSLTENMAPKEVIQLLNGCMTKVSAVIDKYGGVIDKYVGDEVMALFGAPVSKAESSLNAVLCALDIIETLREWNKEREHNNLPKVEMGIGIHKGMVLAGNMGAEDRLNYTVLGSNVNLCSRLCSAAKPMQILISKEVYLASHVQEQIKTQKLEDVSLKGFSETIEVYEVVAKN